MNRKAGVLAGLLAAVMVGVAVLDGKKNMKTLEPLTPVDNPRQAIVDAAASQIGVQDPAKYWGEVLPSAPGFKGDWCGGFALWAVHQAKLAQGVNWEIGKGFCYHLPITTEPRPGDIAYFDQPYQHHAVVEAVSAALVTTIDGNQSGSTVQRRTRPRKSVTAFYSVQPFIDQAYEHSTPST